MPTEQDTLTEDEQEALTLLTEIRNYHRQQSEDVKAIREAIEQLAAAAGQVTEMFGGGGGGGIPFLGGLPSG